MLTATFKAFASNTSMHGVKYIADETKSPGERKFWTIVVILSALGCIYMVGILWNTFISKPTRVYTETLQATTDVIPFPAVTICNTNIISKRKVKEFVNQLNLYNEDRAKAEKAFEVLLAFKYKLQVKFNQKDLDILQKLLTKNRYTVEEVIQGVSHTCEEILVKCSWLGKVVKCGNIFGRSITPDGYCCSFNYNIRAGYKRNNASHKFRSTIKHTLYPGFMMGLTFLLNSYDAEEKNPHLLTSGMEVAIHHSHHYPATKTYKKSLSAGLVTFLQVSGSTLKVSEEVSRFFSDKRDCIFPSERRLRYFREYTQNNCYLECEMLFLLKVCGCVPYFYDFGAGPVCGLSGIPCLFNIKYRNLSKLNCNCPVKCGYVKYNVLSSSTKLVNSEACTWSFMTDTNITRKNILVTVSFVSQTQQVYRRDVVNSTIYLLASFGGIFGLFLGWSFITGAEIVYYFIVHIILKKHLKTSTSKRYNRQKKRRTPSFIYNPRKYLP